MNDTEWIDMDDHYFVNYSGRLYCICGDLNPHDGAKLPAAEYEAWLHDHAQKHPELQVGGRP